LQEVIIRLTNEHNKTLELQLAELKQTPRSSKLQMVANDVEFGHSHGA